MYHHVNLHPEDPITISPENFESQIKYLKGSGYTPLFLSEMFSHLKNRKPAPAKPILITFDDGFLDNWVFAYPILKKYAFKATVFVITSRIGESSHVRPNFEDAVKGRVSQDEIPDIPPHEETKKNNVFSKGPLPDYINWKEAHAMEKSGLIDIQSHSHTHAAYFDGDKVVSFNDGSSLKLGLATGGDLRLGIPVYHMAPSLVARRYFDDTSLRDHLAQFVFGKGGVSFMKSPGFKKAISEELGNFKKTKGKPAGRFEMKEEQGERIREELRVSKNIIEEKLEKECRYICWPWGSVDKLAVKLAKEEGYEGGVGMRGGANVRFTNPMNIHRFNPCNISKEKFVQRLTKYSNLFLSLYNDDRIDDLLIRK